MTDNTHSAHNPTAMRYVGRIPRKSHPTATFKNGKNIWFNNYLCDSCGRRHRIHVNFTPKDKAPMCNGIDISWQMDGAA